MRTGLVLNRYLQMITLTSIGILLFFSVAVLRKYRDSVTDMVPKMQEIIMSLLRIVKLSSAYWNWLKYSLGLGPFFVVPDIRSYCKYPVRLNPNCDEQSQASLQWLSSLAKIEDISKSSRASKFGELTSLVYPNADTLQLRICIDYINCLYWVDDKLEGSDIEGNRKLEEYCTAAMRDPVNYLTDVPEAMLTKSWVGRLEQASSTAFKDRFMQSFLEYLQGVRNEVDVRSQGRIPTVDEYMSIRLYSSAILPSLALAEFCGGYFIPDHVYHHPILHSLRLAAGEHVYLVNDIVSYEKEFLEREGHNNMIPVIMHATGLSLQEAVDIVGERVNECIDRFEHYRKMVPSWDVETDKKVADLITGYQDWMSGHLQWAFTSRRYMGFVKDIRVVNIRE